MPPSPEASELDTLRDLWVGAGLDAVETRHPSHDPDTRARLTDLALALGLRRTGGSDWHGERAPEDAGDREHATIGAQQVPLEWLEHLEAARPA